MAQPTVNRRARTYKILRLFFSLVFDFSFQFARARLRGSSYDFFADEGHNRKRAIKLRNAALEMGGVLIKVGQFLSSRVDLLPSEYIEELALLQDEVPAVPFEQIQPIIETDLGAPLPVLFRAFDPNPVAAASLGQVHRATLHTGAEVGVKVQRPNIGEIVEADLSALRYVVHWLHRHTAISRRANLPQILQEFEFTLRRELDYHAEGHHGERLAVMFQDNPQVVIPRIHWSHTAGRVLTMQFMPGIKVTDFAELDRQHISRSGVAEILMRAYLFQVLDVGFFHADPHPGNIFVRPGPVVVLVDFGMVGEILRQQRENIVRVFLGIVRRDYEMVINALQRLGFFTRNADRHRIKTALAWTVDNFYEMSLGELRAIHPQLVLDEIQDILFAESFQVPANYAFLGRALGTLSGLCTALDPSFQFVTVAEPFARHLLAPERGLRGALTRAVTEARAGVQNAYALPFLARNVLEDVESGEINFRHQFEGVVVAVDRLDRSLRRGTHALFVLGFLLVGALIIRSSYSYAAVVAFVLALLFMVIVLFPFGGRRK